MKEGITKLASSICNMVPKALCTLLKHYALLVRLYPFKLDYIKQGVWSAEWELLQVSVPLK